jgi:hypothetical protein
MLPPTRVLALPDSIGRVNTANASKTQSIHALQTIARTTPQHRIPAQRLKPMVLHALQMAVASV